MRETLSSPMRAGGPGVPKYLYYQGDWTLIQTPCIAIVGTRAPTARASEATFAQEGFAIVSGLAKRIDKAARLGALSVGGKTIAVLGTPLFQCYLKVHATLMATIGRRGLFLMEYRDCVFEPRCFSDRDRLQAALSLTVIPAQTQRAVPGEKQRPGTLYTIRQHSPIGDYPSSLCCVRRTIKSGQMCMVGARTCWQKERHFNSQRRNFLKECFVQDIAASVALS